MIKVELYLEDAYIEYLGSLVKIFDTQTPDYVKHSYQEVIELLIIRECMDKEVIS